VLGREESSKKTTSEINQRFSRSPSPSLVDVGQSRCSHAVEYGVHAVLWTRPRRHRHHARYNVMVRVWCVLHYTSYGRERNNYKWRETEIGWRSTPVKRRPSRDENRNEILDVLSHSTWYRAAYSRPLWFPWVFKISLFLITVIVGGFKKKIHNTSRVETRTLLIFGFYRLQKFNVKRGKKKVFNSVKWYDFVIGGMYE